MRTAFIYSLFRGFHRFCGIDCLSSGSDMGAYLSDILAVSSLMPRSSPALSQCPLYPRPWSPVPVHRSPVNTANAIPAMSCSDPRPHREKEARTALLWPRLLFRVFADSIIWSGSRRGTHHRSCSLHYSVRRTYGISTENGQPRPQRWPALPEQLHFLKYQTSSCPPFRYFAAAATEVRL